MKFAALIAASALALAPALAEPTPATPVAKAPADKAAAQAVAWPRTMRVVIDAGHGGMDKGLVQGGLAEKDVTLQLAVQLRAELEKRGVQVILTRASDVLMPLDARVRVSSELKPDCFVSLHQMQRPPHSLKPSPGISLFYFTPAGKPLASAMGPSLGAASALGASPAIEIQQQRFYVLRQPAPAVLVDVDWAALLSSGSQAPLVSALANGTIRFLRSQPR